MWLGGYGINAANTLTAWPTTFLETQVVSMHVGSHVLALGACGAVPSCGCMVVSRAAVHVSAVPEGALCM